VVQELRYIRPAYSPDSREGAFDFQSSQQQFLDFALLELSLHVAVLPSRHPIVWSISMQAIAAMAHSFLAISSATVAINSS
jgi:hypothetical protein